jgi:hypothetical protein
MSNHAKLEPGIEKIELDGPFVTGTKGRTLATGFEQEWELVDVVHGERFGITGYAPDKSGSLSFWWRFVDEGDGTRITYRISAQGPQVAPNLEFFRGMEERAPDALADLVACLDELARGVG